MMKNNYLKHQIVLLCLALSFLTRIPTPQITSFSEDMLQRMVRYFPLVGFFIGLLCAGVFALSYSLFSPLISSLLSVIFGLALTGAFHEDGLADTLDGFGGGYSVEKKLSIMKDSRVGTYGVVGLWAVLSLKVVSISELVFPVVAIIVAHSASRFNAVMLMTLLPYVQVDSNSKMRLLTRPLTKTDALILLVSVGLLALFIVWQLSFYYVLTVFFMMTMALLFSYCWCKSHIQGYTGDTLGACQQITEILIYLSLLVSVTLF